MNEKLTIEATRETKYHNWSAKVGRINLVACDGDVDVLFNGLKTKLSAAFKITARRPRHDLYHTFTWQGGFYRPIEIRGNEWIAVPSNTSKYIHSKMNKAKTIYVVVEA